MLDPRLLWVAKAPRMNTWSMPGTGGTPVIAGDTIYYIGGYQWQNRVWLMAIDASNGNRRWKTDESISQFIVDGDSIFVVCSPNFYESEPGREHKTFIKAISAKTGEKIWETKTETDLQNIKMLSVGKHVYLVPNPGMIAALNKENGQIVWQKDEQFLQTSPAATCVLADKDQIFASNFNQIVTWMDGDKGEFVSTISLPSRDTRIHQTLSFSNGVLFMIREDGMIGFADPVKKQIEGPFQCGLIDGTILHADRIAYFGSHLDHPIGEEVSPSSHGVADDQIISNAPPVTKDRPQTTNATTPTTPDKTDNSPNRNIKIYSYLNALDIDAKKFLYRIKLKAAAIGTPVIADNLVLVGTAGDDNNLYAFDKKSGELAWKINCGPISGDPVYTNGIVYANGKEQLLAIDKNKGEVLWSVKPREYGPSASPVIQGNVLYMSGQDSNLYAIKLDTAPVDK